MGAVITKGFADPSLDAQAVFRIILGAMAHPGRICSIADANENLAAATAPGRMGPATFALALTLMDFETPVWLGPGFATDQAVIDALRFHCGCPIIDEFSRGNFALVGDPEHAPPLSVFHPGMPEYPDRSTTVVMQVDGLDDRTGVRLTGPGIKTEARLAVDGLPQNFWQQWSANHRQYPLGVDVILTAGDRLAALPRSVAVEV